MAQYNYNITNQSYPATRSAINNVFSAIVSNNSGATAPSIAYAYMWWYDTTNNILKQRNGANTAWIDIGYFDQTNGKFVARLHETLSKTAAYTTVAGDRNKTILANATSAGFTITLLPAATAGSGFVQTFKKTDATNNTVIIDGNGSETIDGTLTLTLSAQYDTVTLICDGSNWHRLNSSPFDSLTASKTGAYTATQTDSFIPCNATSGAFTVALYPAAGNAGRRITIKKTDATLNQITVDANASETIDGALTRKLSTQYETLTLECDGSNWFVVHRRIVSEWVTYTPANTQGFGTVVSPAVWSRRNGDCLEVQGQFTTGTVSAAEARISLGYNGVDQPAGLTVDATKCAQRQCVGNAVIGAAVAASYSALAEASNAFINFGIQSSTVAGTSKAVGNALLGNGQLFMFNAKVPIANWES